MKRSIGTGILVIALTGFAMLAEAQTMSAPLPHYSVINLGTLGGSQANGYGGVTNNGWVSGDSFLQRSQTEHAFVWRDGVRTDLGTLGGPNSGVAYPIKDNYGLIVGGAQGSRIDPLHEYWGSGYDCFATAPYVCKGYKHLQFGFVWQNGVMTKLPTLGGNNSDAAGVNSRGQVAGFAETATMAPIGVCVPPQVLEYKAVVYDGPRGEIEQILPTFPGDAAAEALAINDNGDVVGFSGGCGVADAFTIFGLARHAVVWRNGSVFDLGGFGGGMNNVAQAINNAGQIVGNSDLPGDTITHAALWQNGAITDLGALPGDVYSVANDINARGQVVGASCDANFNCRAWLWDNGVMIDLNSLIPPGSPLYLTWGGGINDRGEIAGSAFDKSNPNEAPAFLAIPAPAAQIAGDSAKKMILPENIRASLQRRLRLRHVGDRPTAQQ
jgi:probable HAF family extracellular repeat protein